jgi:hypothetical protein
MANNGDTDDAQGLNELLQFIANHFGLVFGPPRRLVRIVETLQIDGNDTIVLRQFGDLVSPTDPAIGKTVQEENHVGVFAASLNIVNFRILKEKEDNQKNGLVRARKLRYAYHMIRGPKGRALEASDPTLRADNRDL